LRLLLLFLLSFRSAAEESAFVLEPKRKARQMAGLLLFTSRISHLTFR
jgi:hypothetical protein